MYAIIHSSVKPNISPHICKSRCALLLLFANTKLINRDISVEVNKVALSIILLSEIDTFLVKPYFSYTDCQIHGTQSTLVLLI